MKPYIAAVAVATGPHPFLATYEGSWRNHGVIPITIGWGASFKAYSLKIKLMHDFMHSLPTRYTHIISCDAFDVVAATGLDEIWEKYLTFNSPIVFSAEKNCYPDIGTQDLYPPTPSPNKYLNSGLWMGEIEAVRQMLDDRVHGPAPMSPRCDDQGEFTRVFIAKAAPIVLDYNCALFQSVKRAEADLELDANKARIRNTLTGTYPCLFHGNGRTDMTQILRWLNLLTPPS